MANNFRHNGHRLPVATASAAIASGDFVVQEGFFGIALTKAALGASLWIGADGVWNVPVPASTIKGERLYVAALTDAVNPTLTRTSPSTKFHVGTATTDRDAAGNALVLLAPQSGDVQA